MRSPVLPKVSLVLACWAVLFTGSSRVLVLHGAYHAKVLSTPNTYLGMDSCPLVSLIGQHMAPGSFVSVSIIERTRIPFLSLGIRRHGVLRTSYLVSRVYTFTPCPVTDLDVRSDSVLLSGKRIRKSCVYTLATQRWRRVKP